MSEAINPANLAIGVDLGGTRIKGVLLDTRTGEVLHKRITPTDDGEKSNWKTVVFQTVLELKASTTEPIRGVGLAAPGLPTPDNTPVSPAGCRGWKGFAGRSFWANPFGCSTMPTLR